VGFFFILPAILAGLWLAAAAASCLAADDGAGAQPAAAKPARWTACRPATSQAEAQEQARGQQQAEGQWRPAGSVVPATATAPVTANANSANDPLADPFQDRKAATAAPQDRESPSLTGQATATQQPLPTIRELSTPKAAAAIPCLSPKDLKRIDKISNEVAAEDGDFPTECSLGDPDFQPRHWACTTYNWTASGLCHKPLYFEDEQLERYGHTCGPVWQTLISPAKFFLTFPILPYKMGLTPPNEHIYVLGCYRAGDRSPFMLDPIPLSVRAGLFEAAGWTAGVAAF
jgi:hypothetical protein